MQHFKPIDHWGSEERFKKQQLYDNIKNSFCEENRIKLIRIPYTEYDNIEKILETIK